MPPFTNYYGKIIIRCYDSTDQRKKSVCLLQALRPSSKPSKPNEHCRSSDSLPTGDAFPSSSLENSGLRMSPSFLESSQQRDCPGLSPDSLLTHKTTLSTYQRINSSTVVLCDQNALLSQYVPTRRPSLSPKTLQNYCFFYKPTNLFE